MATHSQAHCLVAPTFTQLKPAKELALSTNGQISIMHYYKKI